MPDLTFTARAGRRYLPFIETNLRRALALIEAPPEELSVALVGDTEMSRLHGRFLNDPAPTDVLTFELDRHPDGRVAAGEVVVCVPEAERQAAGRGTSAEGELLLYALHGVLHLSGFDDTTPDAHATMHRTEDHILTQLGLGPVYHAPPTPSNPPDGGK